jgi:lycopene cyclase domain-containing protein
LNSHYTYFLILLLSLAGPLALSFDKKVAFCKKWKYVFAAMILPALFYIIWDMWFTSMKVWSFNPDYITGIHIFNLPVEEVLFFFVVPYNCTFIYECIKIYFPKLDSNVLTEKILFSIGVFLFIASVFFREHKYSFYTAIFCAAFIFLLFIVRKNITAFNSKVFLISYAIILIPFLVVNGFLTAIPVVLYNNAENLSVRIYTIPVEDIFYGMLLVMMNIAVYEKLLNRS